MNIGTYSPSRKEILYWLITAATFVAMVAIGIWLHNIILNSQYEKQRLYQTAIKTEDKGEFNYSIDSKQGNILAYGNFSFVDLHKFPEMNKKFAYVKKTKEEYTRHTSTSCDSEGNCTTSTYYSWDYAGDEEKMANQVKFMERTYPTSYFDFKQARSIDASEIIKGEKERCYYPERNKSFFGWEDEGDTRYCYDVIDKVITGSILVNTYKGKLDAVEGSRVAVYSQTIAERVTGVSTEATVWKWVFIVFWTLLTIGATIGVTYLWWQYVYY